MGHAGEFYTITSPSKMHAVLSSGKPNPKFNDSTPKDVNEYFKNIWALIRSAIHKKGIKPYGFRVVEPHHDGTPHWHLLLFMHPNDVKTARSIFSKLTLKAQLKLNTDSQERIFLNPKLNQPWRDDRAIYHNCWQPAVKKSGVKFRKQYNTRHTYTSTMLKQNKPIGWVAKQLGHSNISMTLSTYARWIPEKI